MSVSVSVSHRTGLDRVVRTVVEFTARAEPGRSTATRLGA